MALHLSARHQAAWALCPFLAVAAVAALNLSSAEASVSAPVFLFFPAVRRVHLRRQHYRRIRCQHQTSLVRWLKDLAAIDPLTGLLKRRVLDDIARRALTGDRTALLLLEVGVEVDRSESVKAAHGHAEGDEVLVQLSALLMRVASREDIVSRLEGDDSDTCPVAPRSAGGKA
jgi:GGDEF domain-containing protein